MPTETLDTSDITPEMISAGVSALADYSDDFESMEDAVLRIYLSMERLRPHASSSPCGADKERNKK